MSEEILDLPIIQVREKLNKESIKLWLPPYLSSDGSPATVALEELSRSIGQELHLNQKIVLSILLDLQSKALKKLKERDNFLATGVAELRIKISGNSSPILLEKISLSSSTQFFQNQIAEKLNVVPSRVKLISKGRVLTNDKTLADQGVKNGALLMALILSDDTNELQNAVDRQKDLQTTFLDIDLLNSDTALEDSSFQIADQTGKNLTLPKEEKKSLVAAMVLHEKGRAALDRKDYARALVFLLEADHRFNLCTSSILKSVDNYAVLNLDIAWCYLCLGAVTQLPEAEERLHKCEMNFHQSYGPNLERLMNIKGSTGNEQALFMRLHLLQGIVAYHLGKVEESNRLLDRAQTEIKGLTIEDGSLGTLLELGYSEKEARYGLRGGYGDVEKAVNLINKRRDEKSEAIEKNKQDKLNRALGYCADGQQYVRADYMDTLVQMGFVRSLAVEALRESNNALNSAVILIQEQPELLSSRSIKPSTSTSSSSMDGILTPELIEQVSALGFDTSMAAYALQKNNFNVQKTIDELLACNGILEGANLEEISQQMSEVLNRMNRDNPSNPIVNGLRKLDEVAKQNEAYERIRDDITETASRDYFDLDFDTEETFLIKYKSLLSDSHPAE